MYTMYFLFAELDVIDIYIASTKCIVIGNFVHQKLNFTLNPYFNTCKKIIFSQNVDVTNETTNKIRSGK